MKKSNKIQLYCYTHKIPEYGLVDDEIHTPVHVGKELHKNVVVCDVCDNTGDNISHLNEDKIGEKLESYLDKYLSSEYSSNQIINTSSIILKLSIT